MRKNVSNIKPYFSFFPQFTPDPLNDVAWGAGFTDWDLIRKLPESSRDKFTPAKGMYDPTEPEYLAKLKDELKDISSGAGIILYHYFFDGVHVLPGFESELMRQNSDLPFFVCWANETWSKRWIGRPNDLIISQYHHPDKELIRKHVEYLVRLFSLPGYTEHKGRPLILIYNPHASKTLQHSLEEYREAFLGLGVNPFIGACISYPQSKSQIELYDFACEFEPRFFFNMGRQPYLARLGATLKPHYPKIFEFLGGLHDSFRQKAGHNFFDYSDYLRMLENGTLEQELRSCIGGIPLMRSTFLSWDNTPRYKDRSTKVIHDDSRFDEAIKLIGKIHSDSDLPLFVNSWNEWTEGAALEVGKINHQWRAHFLNSFRGFQGVI